MITVYLWIEPPYSPPGFHKDPRWQAIVPDHPEVNATAATQAEVRSFIWSAWARHHPDVAVRFADFEFIERPDEWVNPNEQAEAEIVPEVFVYDPTLDDDGKPLYPGHLRPVDYYVKEPSP